MDFLFSLRVWRQVSTPSCFQAWLGIGIFLSKLSVPRICQIILTCFYLKDSQHISSPDIQIISNDLDLYIFKPDALTVELADLVCKDFLLFILSYYHTLFNLSRVFFYNQSKILIEKTKLQQQPQKQLPPSSRLYLQPECD